MFWSCPVAWEMFLNQAALVVGRAVPEVLELYLKLGGLFLKLVDLFLHLAERFRNLPKLFL
jgi:hypothetical protein